MLTEDEAVAELTDLWNELDRLLMTEPQIDWEAIRLLGVRIAAIARLKQAAGSVRDRD